MKIYNIDITYPRVLLLALVLITVVSSGYAASTSTAAFGSYNPNWDGSRDFRLLAEAHADTDVARSTAIYNNQSDRATNVTAVILSPGEPYTDVERTRIRQFVAQGGTLVVADDFKPYTNALLAGLGVSSRIDGRLLRDERYYYRSPALPIARQTAAPVNQTVEELTLNHASIIDPGENASVLVSSSPYAYLDANRNGELDESETLGEFPVVVSESLGRGRVLIISDPSVFINTMLDQSENRAFATYLLTLNDRVILDYSHTSDIPVLVGVVLALRESILLQLIVGIGVLGVGLLSERYHNWNVQPTERMGESSLSTAEIHRIIEEEHPEWSRERVQRVARSIRESKEGSGDD